MSIRSSLNRYQSFPYFVHVILLNDVIKQRVKIVEEGDNLETNESRFSRTFLVSTSRYTMRAKAFHR